MIYAPDASLVPCGLLITPIMHMTMQACKVTRSKKGMPRWMHQNKLSSRINALKILTTKQALWNYASWPCFGLCTLELVLVGIAVWGRLNINKMTLEYLRAFKIFWKILPPSTFYEIPWAVNVFVEELLALVAVQTSAYGTHPMIGLDITFSGELTRP